MSSYPRQPLGTVLKRIQESVAIDPHRTYKQVTVRLFHKGVVLRGEKPGSAIRTTRQWLVRRGQVLLSRIDARNGAIGIVPPELEDAVVTNDFWAFDVNPDLAIPQFLDAYFGTPEFVDACNAASEGTTNRVRLQPERFLRVDVPLPPIAEQRRVVSHIEEVAAKVREAVALRKETGEAADSLLGAEIERLFTLGPGKGWNRGCLGDFVLNDCYGTSEKTNDDASGTPILRMGNIQNGRLDTRNLKYLRIRDRDREKWILRKGDILVNRTNSAELVGKCAVFDLDDEYGFASYIIRLRLDTTRALPRLVAAYINSPVGRAYMFNERKQMTGQANVNSKKLKALPIALPLLPEQHRILAYLDELQAKVDDLKKLQSETAGELDALMPSILSKAFRGEL